LGEGKVQKDLCCKEHPENLRVALSHREAACSFVQISNLEMNFHHEDSEEVPTQSAA